jgi:diaminopimelate epimerase
MQLHFSKMHGLGNDFVVIDAIHQSINLSAAQIQLMADRHRGIGCDQVLLLEKSLDPTIDFIYRIFNADGSEVGQCGNGARCIAKFAAMKKLTAKKNLRVKTFTHQLEIELNDDDTVTVNMGLPQNIHAMKINEIDGINLSLGNPHIVFTLADIQKYSLQEMGSLCNQHPAFPEGINVGFMQIIDRQNILLRVYERGAGETQACGSGACAAVVAGIIQHQLDTAVTVQLLGGQLTVQWQSNDSAIFMTGPAVNTFEGVITL